MSAALLCCTLCHRSAAGEWTSDDGRLRIPRCTEHPPRGTHLRLVRYSSGGPSAELLFDLAAVAATDAAHPHDPTDPRARHDVAPSSEDRAHLRTLAAQLRARAFAMTNRSGAGSR